jgi:hypothetical protein
MGQEDMQSDSVHGFLTVLAEREKDKWHFHQPKNRQYWKVNYSGCKPPCKFFIETDTAQLYLCSPLKIKVWRECRPALYRFALRLNEEIAAIKIGLGHDGNLSIMVEEPWGEQPFVTFEAAVKTLLACYRTYFGDLQLVAQDVTFAERYEDLAYADEKTPIIITTI